MTSVLTKAQKQQFYDDGYLILEDFFDNQEELKKEADRLLADFDLDSHPKTRFTTDEKAHIGDEWFLESGDKIRTFFEEDAFDSTGNLARPKEESVNKIGHALHTLNPIFRDFTLKNDKLKQLARDLDYHKDPRVLQSMLIFKQPRIGGKVSIHDDSTFLYTDSPSALGFWFALEDCTETNGCLSFVPGSHKRNKISKRFVRLPEGGTGFSKIGEEDDINWEAERWQPGPCKAGSLVLIDGKIIHRSEKNLSDKSRFIYTFHMIESESHGAVYDKRNWLQPTAEMPFSRLFDL